MGRQRLVGNRAGVGDFYRLFTGAYHFIQIPLV
jgi:hypothetical protein